MFERLNVRFITFWDVGKKVFILFDLTRDRIYFVANDSFY